MRIVRTLLSLAVVAGIVVGSVMFVNANATPVAVDYLAGQLPEVPLWAVIIGSFGAGMIVTGVLSLYEVAKQGFVARRYRKAAEGLESEIHQMRNLPLVESDEAAAPNTEAPAAERSA